MSQDSLRKDLSELETSRKSTNKNGEQFERSPIGNVEVFTTETGTLLPDAEAFVDIKDLELSGSESETDIPVVTSNPEDDSNSSTVTVNLTARPEFSSESDHITSDISEQLDESSLDGRGMNASALLNAGSIFCCCFCHALKVLSMTPVLTCLLPSG